MKLSSLALDMDAVDNGALIPIPWMDGISILCRSSLSAAYRYAHDDAIAAAARALPPGRDTVPPDQAEAIEAQCLLTYCLLGWQGFEQDDGTPLPFSADLAATVMTDPKYLKVRRAVRYAAQQVGQTVAAQTDQAAGN